MQVIEFVGAFCGIWGVYLTFKNSYWGFVVGLLNTLVYIYICWTKRLYGESFLNLYYSIMNVIGVFKWVRRDNLGNVSLAITRVTKKQLFYTIALLCIGWGSLGYTFFKYTDNVSPFWDAFIVVCSYIGMGLMVYKKLENWLWWIVVNVVSIYVYYQRGLWITSIQYVILLGIAVIAYIDWRKKLIRKN